MIALEKLSTFEMLLLPFDDMMTSYDVTQLYLVKNEQLFIHRPSPEEYLVPMFVCCYRHLSSRHGHGQHASILRS